MQAGAWHQCGHQCQTVVRDFLNSGVGAGVILSARDLRLSNAVKYTEHYHAAGADVILDYQFYVPDFTNQKLQTYALNPFRLSVSQLNQISDNDLSQLSQQLQAESQQLGVNAVLAPAVIYEAGQPQIMTVNSRLLAAAKSVGNVIGVPTYSTVVLGQSVVASDQSMISILDAVTALNADGWYFGFEFPQKQRIPFTYDQVRRCCIAGLRLACTGRPVLHAYASPMSILSLGFGATGVGIGRNKSMWHFNRGRFGPPEGGGGQGGPPVPRFFSRALWGTIVRPDEVVQLSADLQAQVLLHSPYSQGPIFNATDARKHALHEMCSMAQTLMAQPTARQRAEQAVSHLNGAVHLHTQISTAGITLGDNTSAYQANWSAAMNNVLTDRASDYDYLELLG